MSATHRGYSPAKNSLAGSVVLELSLAAGSTGGHFSDPKAAQRGAEIALFGAVSEVHVSRALRAAVLGRPIAARRSRLRWICELPA